MSGPNRFWSSHWHQLRLTSAVVPLAIVAFLTVGLMLVLMSLAIPSPAAAAILAEADLGSSTKEAPAAVGSGATLPYTITIVNSDLLSDTLSTTVSDTLPAGVSYVSGTLTATSGIVTPTTGGIAWSGVVSAGERVTITFVVTVSASPGEVITNHAIISATALGAPVTATAVTTVGRPDLSLSRKTCSVDRLSEDEQATYAIVIENSGLSDGEQTTLSDAIPAGTTYIPGTAWASDGVVTGTAAAIQWSGSVAAGEAVEVSFVVSATASHGDRVTNRAIISDVELLAPVIVSVTNPVVPYVDFELNKVVTPAIVEPGDALSYTLRFTSTGNYTGTGTSLLDLIPANTTYNGDATASRPGLISSTTAITWTGDLEVGDGVSITFSVQANPTFHGFITNTATISQTYLPQPIARQAVAVAIPLLNVEKSVTGPAPPAPVGPGKLMTYTLEVRNAGSIASGLLITDRLPLSTTYASGGTFVAATGVVSWTPSFTLPTGAEETFTFTVQVSPTVVSGTVIVNDDYVVSSAEGAVAFGAPVEMLIQDPILAITKWADPDPPGANRDLTYSVRVRNSGSLATGLTITDIVPANVAYVSGGTYSAATGVVSWTWPSLAFGASQVFTYQVAVGNLYSGTEIVNGRYAVSCAEGITATGGPLTLTIQPPILETSYKYADPAAVKPGEDLDFIIVLRNTGASNAIGATMTDTFPTSVAQFQACTASSGVIVQCGKGATKQAEWTGDILHNQSVQITLTVHIVGSNSVTNTAYISDDLLAETFTVTARAEVTNFPALVVSKSDKPDPVAPGRLLTYTITVVNYGLPTGGPVYLTDTVPAGTTYYGGDGTHITPANVVTWTLPSLQPNDSTEALLVVQVGDLPSSTLIYNEEYTATCDICTSPARGLTVTTLVQLPLQASKRVEPGLATAEQILTYTIAVDNVSGVTATQTTISDRIPLNTSYVAGSLSYPSGTASDDAAILAHAALTWTGDITPHEKVDLTFQAKVDLDFSQGTITNTAVISQADLVFRPLTATAVAIVSTLPILELDKVPSASVIEPLELLTYTLWLTNTGREATGLVISDVLPADTTYVWSDGTLIAAANVVTWTWPSLDWSQRTSLTLVVQVNNVPSGTQIVNGVYTATCLEGVSAPGAPVTTTVQVVVPPVEPQVFGIDPNSMLNLTPLTTTISGSDFVSPTAAALNGTSLGVTWVDTWTLEAVVPAGMAPGLYDLTVTNPGLGLPSGVLTEAFTVTNQVDHFRFAPVSTQTAGVPFSITLAALDAFDWPVEDYGGTVTLADSTNTISPTLSPAFVNGQVSITVAITLADPAVVITAADGPSSGSSNPFAVVAGPFAGFRFAAIDRQTINVPFTITIWTVDLYGNITTGFSGTVTLADTTGTISPTVSGAFSNGTWSGAVVITQLTAATAISATGGGFDGASTLFAVTSPPPIIWAVAPHTFPNLLPQALAISGTGFVSPTTVLVDGTALTVTGVSLTRIDATVRAGLAPGSYDLTVINPGLGSPSGVLSNAITLTNSIDHFVFSPVSTQTARVAFGVVITAVDAFDYLVTTYTGTNTLTDTTGTLTPGTTPAFAGATVQLTVTIHQAQLDAVIATTGGGRTGVSNPFDVVSGVYNVYLPIIVKDHR